MAFVPDVLSALDVTRSVGGLLGLRAYTVFTRTRVWTGKVVGDGTFVDNAGGPDVQLFNGVPPVGPVPVRVRLLSNQEIIASGGLYRDRDMKVGPLTPPYPAGLLPAGGTGDQTLDPPQVGSLPTEIFWLVRGPGIASVGAWCRLVQLEATALHYLLVVRADGTQP